MAADPQMDKDLQAVADALSSSGPGSSASQFSVLEPVLVSPSATAPTGTAPAAANPTTSAEPGSPLAEKKGLFSKIFARKTKDEEVAELADEPRGKKRPDRIPLEKVLEIVLFAVGSKDRWTRRVGQVFFGSATVSVVILVLIWQHFSGGQLFRKKKGTQDNSEVIGEFMEKQSESAKTKFSWTAMGSFLIPLETPESRSGIKIKGVFNVAQVEIVAQCDSRDTCDYIDNHMESLRDRMSGVLQGIRRDEILALEGKRKLRLALVKKINEALPKGKIDDVYFSKLIIS